MTTGEAWRLFIAIELPSFLKDALSAVQDSLLTVGGGAVRWVDAKGIHVTLKFLGSVDSGRLAELQAALQRACLGVGRLSLTLSGLGAFPNSRLPRVLWVGVAGDTGGLAELARRVDEEMASLGFAREARAFSAHLTLGRVRDSISSAQRRALGEALCGVEVAELGSFTAGEVSLMRSELSRQGARYHHLGGVPLSS